MADQILRIGRRKVAISKADKLFFPDDGITKGGVVAFYRRIADVMLPLMRGHPIVMYRLPDGLQHEGFYQKDAPADFPSWIPRVTVEKEGGHMRHVVCEDAATLVYLANQACITPHLWLSRKDKLDHPDRMVFDLDPPQEFAAARNAALQLKDLLEDLGLRAFVMTTGSRGLHVYVPLDRRSNFDSVRSFARGAADLLARRYPAKLTTEQRLNKRRGRLFLDTLRNAYAQTSVAPYALRAKPGAPVAMPLDWTDLAKGHLSPQQFTIENVFRRIDKKGNPWAGISRHSYSIAQPARRLSAMQKSGSGT